MGEAKRRKNLGLPPRKKISFSDSKKANFINLILNKYPYSPYIFGFSLLTILIIDLIKYYG